MKKLLALYNLLSAQTAIGGVCVILLFLFCFLGVHLANFLKGRPSPPSPPSPPPSEPPKEKAPTESEPIYYIVEKKRRRTKPLYGEPKEIRFKKEDG